PASAAATRACNSYSSMESGTRRARSAASTSPMRIASPLLIFPIVPQSRAREQGAKRGAKRPHQTGPPFIGWILKNAERSWIALKQAQPTYSAYTQEDMDALYGTRPATTNSQAPECPEGYVPYTIEAGDTLRSIASSRGITVNELLFYNP